MDFSKPMDVTNVEIVFGGNIDKLMPSYKDIPDEFKCDSKWPGIVAKWFFTGLPSDTDFFPKEGVDLKKAINHIMAILVSFAPKHEHKQAGCAYLLSLWFDDIVIPKKE